MSEREGRSEEPPPDGGELEGTPQLLILPTSSIASTDDRCVPFMILNHGLAAAHDVRVWLVNEQGEDVSIESPAPFTLEPGKADQHHVVTVPLEVEAKDVRFVVGWIDETGHHKELFGTAVILEPIRPGERFF